MLKNHLPRTLLTTAALSCALLSSPHDALADTSVWKISRGEDHISDIYQTLLVNRNKNWLPKRLSYFATDEIEFVLVGAGHLVGDEGLLQLLQSAGYTVEQL